MQHEVYMVPVNCKQKIPCMDEPEYHNEAGEGENKMAHCVFSY
jgi:hypothetical protein